MRRLSGVLLLALALGGCARTSGTTIGVVTAVEGDLVDITSFRVLSSGSQIEFLPIPGQEYGIDLPHLREHLRTAEQIIVEWELTDDLRYAISISDA